MPIMLAYELELDEIPELDANYRQYYQERIGMLIWANEQLRVGVML